MFGEKADEMIERSKVERSLMLRKPQTPFGVVWSLLELKTAPQGEERTELCHLCVSLSVRVICFNKNSSLCACGGAFSAVVYVFV